MTNYAFSQLVWGILSGVPMEVVDSDLEETWSSDLWELVSPRTSGDMAGSKVIGSANLIAAYNIIHDKVVAARQDIDTLDYFRQILDNLVTERRIRKCPERVRQNFRVI